MKNVKKATTLLLASLMAGSALLSACSNNTPATTPSEETTTATTTEATTTVETTTETTETTIPNGRDTTPYKALVLDGDKDHHFLTTDYCFIESEKYVLFLDKDLDIPGDFTANLDAIINEIETELGLPYAPADFEDRPVSNTTAYYGINPWENWRIGNKIGIFVAVDREDGGYGNSVYNSDIVIHQYELITKDFWNSVPSYKKAPDRRPSYVCYHFIADTLAQCILQRHCKYEIPAIMSKGVGQYLSRTVINALAADHPSLSIVKKKRYLYDAPIPQVVTAKNAESIFASDYYDKKAGYANPNAQQVYGRYFVQFLFSQYGKEFFKEYVSTVNNYGDGGNQVGIVTASCGDKDVFKKFGTWCKKHKALQKKGGVW